MRHDPYRTVLENREQRDHIIAVASRQDYLIGGNNAKIDGARADHLHGRSPGAARKNLHVQTVLRIRRYIESTEFRLGLPVQSQLSPGRLTACGQKPQRGHCFQECSPKHAVRDHLMIVACGDASGHSARGHSVACSEACQRRSIRWLNRFINPNSPSPSRLASRTAANTLSIRCCVRAMSTTEPSPPPAINSPTMAPITASPADTRSPVNTCGSAAGRRNLNSVTKGDAP